MNAGIVSINKYTFVPAMGDMMWNFLIGAPFPGDKNEFKSLVDAAELSINTSVKKFVILYAYKYLRFIPGLTIYKNTWNWFRKTEAIIKVTNAAYFLMLLNFNTLLIRRK